MINRKGISNIVGTVILVMLSLTAVTMVWQMTLTLIDPVQFAPALNCLEAQGKIDLKNACFNGEDIEITIEKSLTEIEMINLEFIIGDDERTYSCGNSCGSCEILNEGEVKKYLFGPYSSIPTGEVLVHVDGCELDRVDIVTC